MIKKILNKLIFLFTYYIVCQGNLLRYLLSNGVRVGRGSELFNQLENYGSEPWLIEIGENVTITRGVYFICHDASSRLFRKSLENSSKYGNRFGKIQIFDNCFIGINSIIMPDVKIGPNSIVGAGSLVLKDVQPNTVVAGVPAKKIATLDEYQEKYKNKMVPINATSRSQLRTELTQKFWGEVR